MVELYAYGLKGDFTVYTVDLYTLHREKRDFREVREEYAQAKAAGNASYFHHTVMYFWRKDALAMDYPLFSLKCIDRGFMLVYKEFGLGLMLRAGSGLLHLCQTCIEIGLGYLNDFIVDYFYKEDKYHLQVSCDWSGSRQATVLVSVDSKGKAQYSWKIDGKVYSPWRDFELLSPRQVLLGKYNNMTL